MAKRLPRLYFSGEFQPYEQLFRKTGYDMKFAKGEYLCKPGDELDTVYYIVKGLANFSICLSDGNIFTPMYFGDGSMFPLICTEDGFALEFSIMFQACTDMEVIVLSIGQMRELLTNHELACECVDHYCKFSNQFIARSISTLFISSENRLADFLYLYLHYKPEKDNQIFLTQQDIASITGLSHAQLGRILANFRNQKIIETRRGSLLVLDLDKLLKACSSLANPERP